ncbi:hypothetical protein EDC19_0709 [Natranaerovirga hydrolytica]|uniref:AEC family transporter n=1 Tax=Natranaerovirga hydrolytica TaxID=680378 RepID=A0A4R1N5M0_9FIRM|nr:AEC family transporter [Natranaerovirga hydrolytica]TCK98289.1 hypothetical protein EDC19_0709 [Natranaerovirga hydrolytica]
MDIFLHIVGNNIVPIFLLIGIGFVVSRKFEIDIKTLSKINFYIFVPGFVLVNLYTTEIPLDLLKVLVFAITFLMVNMLIGSIIAKVRNYDDKLANAYKNSIMFYNSGNIGIPLITLVFSASIFTEAQLNLAVTAQIMVMVVQNITTNTIGFFNADKANMHWKQSIKKILKMPTVYAIPTALILKWITINTGYDFTEFPGWPGLEYIRSGLISIALVSLGVQLSKTKVTLTNKKVYLAVAIRLIGGPIMAVGLIMLMGFDGVVAQTLMISSSVPTAVNTALIAVECDNCPDFASQTVMFATLLSAITLTFVIFTAGIIFPI